MDENTRPSDERSSSVSDEKRCFSSDPELDYSESSTNGADGEYDATNPSNDDGRSGMRTTFYPSEAIDPSKYQRLKTKQEQRASKQDEREALRRRDAATWCSSLDFTSRQRDRVLYLIDNADLLDALDGYSLGAPEAILATMVHVAAEDGRQLLETRWEHPDGRGLEARNARVQTIFDHVGTEADQVAATRELLRGQFEKTP